MASSNLELSRFGGRYNHGIGALILAADLNQIGDIGMRNLMGFLSLMFYDRENGYPQSGFPRDVTGTNHCEVTSTGDLTFSVASGWGLVYDAADLGTEEFAPSAYLPVVLESAYAGALEPHHATLPRVDIVCIAPAYATDQAASRNVKDPSDGAVSSSSIAARKRFSATVSVVTGTPAASPSAPSVPAGAIEIARAFVPATSGAATWVDHRPPLQFGHYFTMYQSFLADFVLTSDELEVTASTPAGMSVAVSPGRAMIGGLTRMYKRQPALAIAAAHPTNPRIDLVTAKLDGTLAVVTGTAAATPVAPSVPANSVTLAEVSVLAAATSISSARITDRRDFTPLDGTDIREATVNHDRLTVPEVFVELGTPTGTTTKAVPISLFYPDGATEYEGPFDTAGTPANCVFEAVLYDMAAASGQSGGEIDTDFAASPPGVTAINLTVEDSGDFVMWFKPASGDADNYNYASTVATAGRLIFWMPSRTGTLKVTSAITGFKVLIVRPLNRPGACSAVAELVFS